jgi:hypothetical protein
VLNNLYKTRIRDIDIETVAAHITGLNVDPLLAAALSMPLISS